jgi:superfamily II DNA or RNA helicase
MEHPLKFAPVSQVKDAIARAWLERSGREERSSLGTVVLRPHQREAVARIVRTLERERVALLADDVGLGKTYTAIAVAATARAPLIVAPAALRDMWREALGAARVRAAWTSYEQLSRGACLPGEQPDLVILDEAQHARTPTTIRYGRLAALAAGARVLLISATPIHNSRNDLTALFALALGRSARSLDDDAIAAHTVRRTHDEVPAEPLPVLEARGWIRVPDDEDLLQRLLSLPPPLPARDAGDGGVLLTWTLVRLWASTRGALRAALRRRVQRGWALRQALQSGVHPTAGELVAWQCSDQAVQLAFPELIASPAVHSTELLVAVNRHIAALEELLAHLTSTADPDRARADALRTLRRESPGQRVLVFSQFADSVSALWRLLRNDPGVAVLTSKGALVAGGAISRREALRRFAPRALRAAIPARADAIELLISTDFLSEGVNLQDASVIVHLDLPWTHARLAQRVGRVRRMGSLHSSVRVFTFAPPASTERLLEVERRIAAKLGAAARTLGVAGAILPSMLGQAPQADDSPARAGEHLRALLARWQTGEHSQVEGAPLAAVVRGECNGAMAALIDREAQVALASVTNGVVSTDPRELLAAAAALEALEQCAPDAAAVRREYRRLEQWADARAADRAVGGAISIEGAARRATLRRLASIVARTPIARRHELAPLATEARRVAGSAIGAGGELILGQLATAQMPDDAWLRAVAAFAEAHGHRQFDSRAGPRPRIVALIVVVPRHR